jgi:hypothetical protein
MLDGDSDGFDYRAVDVPAKRVPTVHNPTNFDPAAYEVLDYLDNKRPEYCGGSSEGYAADVEFWERDMREALGDDWRRKSHRCVHCGNGNIRWITVTRHIPTGDSVVFGADCTARLGFADRLSWKLAQLKSKAEAGHARLKVWKAREATLAAYPALALALTTAADPVHARNTFAQDVIGKLNHFGSLSQRQVEALVASLARDVERAAQRAQEATLPVGNAPSGRQTATGTVLSLKLHESSYGEQLKMLVQLENRAKVWLSVPSAASLERGDVVTVTATFTVSPTDSTFAFGKRPILVSTTRP